MNPMTLFTETLFQTRLIYRRKDFDELFEGFTSLKAISYVASPDLILEFFERRGYEHVEILVGENLSEPYRQALEQKGMGVIEQLTDRIEKGILRIYIPPKTIHTKLYLLERKEVTRIILTSANLTETARQASRQMNYAWFTDVSGNHPWLEQVKEDYENHLKGSSVFMGDLMELLQNRQETPKQEVIDLWLRGKIDENLDQELKKVLQEISASALQAWEIREEALITVRLPGETLSRRRIERFLSPVNPVGTQQDLQIDSASFIRYIQESHGFPLMHVDLEKTSLRLGIHGKVETCSEPLPEKQEVGQTLVHLEAYLNTVDWGQSPDPKLTKTNMYEALLYIFASPFSHEYMKMKRRKFGVLDRRGPRFLYIYGPSQNGKSTFLRFALKLLTGYHLQPFSGSDFSKRKILSALSIGTVFPLIFDDLAPTQKGSFEEVSKSFWEVWWEEACVCPQILMSSNIFNLKDWAKSRLKRVDFDVHFAPNEKNKAELAQIFTRENRIFRWFSKLYLEALNKTEVAGDDELYLARWVMKKIYEFSGTPVPDFFPHEPIERLYDPGRRSWKDVLGQLKKAKIKNERDRLLVEFSDDLQHHEVREYQGALPQTVKNRLRGKTLIIESPKEFHFWLNGTLPPKTSWLSRVFRRRG
ncbi:MAG: phospholipase D family protein [Chlamydiae bacterium]|nr:phospholipase D family protein [Chlamydiota bacterium]MBI3276313.1 phospholipase D family protein [Chlamydiota bacterium]